MKKLSKLWHFMKNNRGKYILSILFMGVSVGFSLMVPVIIQMIVDSFIGELPSNHLLIQRIIQMPGGREYVRNNLWIGGLAIIAVTAIYGLFLFLSNRMSAEASEDIAKNIRDRVYDHIQQMPFDYHKNSDTGDLLQRATSDVETVRRFLSIQLMEVGRAVFMVIIALYFMLQISWKMTVAAMILTPIIFFFGYIFFIKVQKAFKISDEAEAELSTVIQENLHGTRVVRAFAREKFEIEKFKAKNKSYAEKTYRLIKYLAYYWSISDFISLASIGLVLVAGVYFTYVGEITLGAIIVFIQYEYRLLWPIRQLGRILSDLGKAIVSSDRIQEILDGEIELDLENETTPEIKGEIVFDDVSFAYPDNFDRKVLDHVSFTVKKGQTVAVIGRTGSGKSSLIHLLGRLYDVDDGRIMIDGVDIRNIQKKWLRKHIGIVLQEPFLFSKTIKDNINFSSQQSENSIYEAAKIASVHEVIKEFDKGYDTLVGEKGVTLSGGQKQRLAIARTLVNDYPILAFDDSLSAVDTETDIAIRKALAERKKDITTFIISHRVASVYDADNILVVEDGKIIERGTHAELMALGGYYKRIWDIQMA